MTNIANLLQISKTDALRAHGRASDGKLHGILEHSCRTVSLFISRSTSIYDDNVFENGKYIIYDKARLNFNIKSSFISNEKDNNLVEKASRQGRLFPLYAYVDRKYYFYGLVKLNTTYVPSKKVNFDKRKSWIFELVENPTRELFLKQPEMRSSVIKKKPSISIATLLKKTVPEEQQNCS